MLNDDKVNSKPITATGVFTSEEDVENFLDTLRESELGRERHHEAPIQKIVEGNTIKIVLHIKDHAVFLIKSSLQQGMLHEWREKFTITDYVPCN